MVPPFAVVNVFTIVDASTLMIFPSLSHTVFSGVLIVNIKSLTAVSTSVATIPPDTV